MDLEVKCLDPTKNQIGWHDVSTWRLPPRVPGESLTSYDSDRDGDFTYPEQMHRDALEFYLQARDAEHNGDPRGDRDRWVRAGVLSAFQWFEAYLNRASFGHALAHSEKLDAVVRDVLLERETAVDDRGRLVERRRRIGLASRLLFLTAFLSGEEFPRGTRLWERLRVATDLRDSIVHPKPPFPWEFPADSLRDTLDTLTEVLNTVQGMLELEPLPSWKPADELLRQRRDESATRTNAQK